MRYKLLLLCCCWTQTQAADRPAELGVVTWNIHGARGGMDAIVDALRKLDADVICLQEAEKETEVSRGVSQAEEIARKLDRRCYAAGSSFATGGQQQMAILTRTPLRDTRTLDAGTGRIYGVSGLLETRGKAVRIYSVHLTGTWKTDLQHLTTTSAARFRESEHLCAELRKQKVLFVLAGDFNATPDMAEHRCLTKVSSPLPTTQPTFPSDQPRLRIDEVYTSRGVRVVKHRVESGRASDHRAITVQVELNAQ